MNVMRRSKGVLRTTGDATTTTACNIKFFIRIFIDPTALLLSTSLRRTFQRLEFSSALVFVSLQFYDGSDNQITGILNAEKTRCIINNKFHENSTKELFFFNG